MARPEGPGRPLPVDVELAGVAGHDVRFQLAGVVRYVVDEVEAAAGHHVGEHLAGEVGDHLAVGQRTIDRRAHGAEIALPQRRFDRRAGEFAIRQVDAVLGRGNRHLAQEFGADLVAEATRTAVDAHHHFAAAQAEAFGNLLVVDLDDLLQFQVVIARAERADLVALPALGMLGNLLRFGAGHAAVLLDAFQIGLAAVAAVDRPARPATQHGIHFRSIESDAPGAADARRHVREQTIGEALLERLDLGDGEPRVQRAHAAGDVESDATGRHDTTLLGVERRDPTDGKAVAPVRVRHGVGRLDDARQAGDVADLLAHLVVHLADQPFVGKDDRRHAHPAAGLDAPFAVRYPLQLTWIHLTRPPRIAPAIRRRRGVRP